MKKFWPEVADQLAALNEQARRAFGEPADIPERDWPSWAPTPGSWIREAYQGQVPDDRHPHGAWHIARRELVLREPTLFIISSLCGRDFSMAVGGDRTRGRYSTVDVSQSEPKERACRRCLAYLPKKGIAGPGFIKPWGDRGAAAWGRR